MTVRQQWSSRTGVELYGGLIDKLLPSPRHWYLASTAAQAVSIFSHLRVSDEYVAATPHTADASYLAN